MNWFRRYGMLRSACSVAKRNAPRFVVLALNMYGVFRSDERSAYELVFGTCSECNYFNTLTQAGSIAAHLSNPETPYDDSIVARIK